mmetsp:Transcript_35009/g.87308  ORF Transcript_35009/g.87308 Transcript_35009/m.87308 type:complete len:280 (+) Transcript_35009:424-1263(+)
MPQGRGARPPVRGLPHAQQAGHLVQLAPHVFHLEAADGLPLLRAVEARERDGGVCVQVEYGLALKPRKPIACGLALLVVLRPQALFFLEQVVREHGDGVVSPVARCCLRVVKVGLLHLGEERPLPRPRRERALRFHAVEHVRQLVPTCGDECIERALAALERLLPPPGCAGRRASTCAAGRRARRAVRGGARGVELVFSRLDGLLLLWTKRTSHRFVRAKVDLRDAIRALRVVVSSLREATRRPGDQQHDAAHEREERRSETHKRVHRDPLLEHYKAHR